jgi:nucleoside-diphosphate-sugar epimerase
MNNIYLGKRVLVTGGLGFIGSNVVHRLVECGAEVGVIDSLVSGHGGTLENLVGVLDEVNVSISDIRDMDRMVHLVKDYDLVFSLAGQVSHSESMRDPLRDLSLNCQSQLALLESLRRCNPDTKVVYTSTRQVYGCPEDIPVDERHPLNPVDTNGIHKMASEHYFSLYYKVFGIRSVILRLTNTYGPRMDLENDSKGFLGTFIRKALCGDTVCIYGDGSQIRDLNYVDDVVDAILLAGAIDSLDGNVFNLGHPEPVSLQRIVDILQTLLDFPSKTVPFPAKAKAIDIGDYWGDYSRYRSETNWEPSVSVEEGLHRTVEWYQEFDSVCAQ